MKHQFSLQNCLALVDKKVSKPSVILLLCLVIGLSAQQANAQCTVDYFGWWGDSPANTPNASVLNSTTGVTASAMTGGAGITLNNAVEAGSTGAATVFQMVGLSNVDFTTAITNNDYMYSTITVPAGYNKIRLARIRMKNIGASATGSGASSWGVRIYDVTAGTATTLFQDVAIANAATSDVTGITAFDMLPGKTYQIRIFVYNLSGLFTSLTTRSFDNPIISFQAIPNLSSTAVTICAGNTTNLTSLLNTNVSTTNTTVQWFTDEAHTIAYNTPNTAGVGIYYAPYHDNTNNCNGPTSDAVKVNMDTDCDGFADNIDLDNDNDGILDTDENVCALPLNQTVFLQGFESGVYTGDLGNGVSMQGADMALYSAVGGTGGQIGSAPNNSADLSCLKGEEQCEGAIVTYPFTFSCGGAANQSITGTKGVFINSCYDEANKDYNGNSIPGEAFKFINIPLSKGFTYDFSFKLINIYATGGNYTFSARLYNSSNTLISSTDITVDAAITGSIISSSGSLTVPASGLYSIVYVLPVTATGGDFLVDDVSLTKRVCDYDNDGIPNYLDLDSDGDTCPDAIEADENVLNSQLTGNKISGAVDANGVPVLVNTGGSADIGADQGQGIGTSQNASLKETASITTQPLASQALCPNTTPSNLTVVATGSPALTYQWYSNTTSLTTGGTAISGATAATYTPSTATAGTFYYYVIVTGSCGSATSDVSTLIVNPLPTAYSVTGGGSYCAGGSGVSVGLSGSQSGVNYQLQLNGSNSGATVAGTGAAISFGNQISNGTYTVVATNSATGCTVNMTGNAIVTINLLPIAPVVSASMASNICPTSTVNIGALVTSATPSGCSILYKTTDNPNGTDVADATKVGAGTYYIFYKNASGCSSYPGTPVTVTIHSCNDLSITKAVSDMSPLVGSDVVFTITAFNGSTDMVTATEVKVTEKLLPHYEYKSYTATTGVGTYDNATGIWTIGNLAPNSSAELKITATVK